MKRILCDICEKDIFKDRSVFNRPVRVKMKRYVLETWVSMDICDECAEIIYKQCRERGKEC